MWKHTFDFFGYKFTISVSKLHSWKAWKEQISHVIIHFVLALITFSPKVSFGIALGIEIRDGEHGHEEEWKEGFNIFPDLVFRALGALIYVGAVILLEKILS